MRSTSGWTQGSSLYSLIIGQTFRLQAAAILLGLALPVLAVFPLELQQRLIDEVIPAGDTRMIGVLAMQYAGVVVLASVVKFLVTYIRGWIQEIVSRMLRVAIIQAQRRRRGLAASQKLGAVTSVITAEVEDLGGFASEALNTPLIEGGTLLSLLGFVAYSEPRLAIIGVTALVLQAILTPALQRRINVLTRKRIQALRRAGLDMIETASSGQHEPVIGALYEVRRTYRLRLRMNILKGVLRIANNIVMHAATIAILGYGGSLVIQGDIGIGLVVAFLTGLRQIDEHWSELLDFYRRYTDARVKYRLVKGVVEDD
jgi:ABC-type bacteriocin/lantibiotic exporter with double-glycine peptidase domain